MVRKAIIAVALLISVSGCASTAIKKYVGGSISEAYISYGKPENVFDLPDGRRAFQFYWGGGSGVVPGRATARVTGNERFGYEVTTTGTPAMIYESNGCLVTLITRPSGSDFIVEEYRIPQRLVC